MTEQEMTEELQSLIDQIKSKKHLTPEEVKQMQEAAEQTPEVIEIKRQIRELKAIDAALTGRRNK